MMVHVALWGRVAARLLREADVSCTPSRRAVGTTFVSPIVVPIQLTAARIDNASRPAGASRKHDTHQLHAMAPGLVGQTIQRAGGYKRMRLVLADAKPPSCESRGASSGGWTRSGEYYEWRSAASSSTLSSGACRDSTRIGVHPDWRVSEATSGQLLAVALRVIPPDPRRTTWIAHRPVPVPSTVYL
jgi:hypothetical protein